MSNVPSLTFAPSNLQLLGRAVAATTDITALARLVGDAYQATVDAERDIAATQAYFQFRTQLAEFEHKEIMKALQLGFEKQERAIETIERISNQLIANQQFEAVQVIVTRMLELLQTSPVKDAYSGRLP